MKKNKEDGWVTIKIKDKLYEGVLEIKSTQSSHFGESGIRQLSIGFKEELVYEKRDIRVFLSEVA